MRALPYCGAVVGLSFALGTGSAQQPGGRADLCALLTETEAEAILDKPLAPPEPQPGGDCWYPERPGSGGGEIMLHVLPERFDSEQAFHAFIVKEVKDLDAQMKKSLEKTGATIQETAVEPVPEAGAPAYYADPSLFVLQGGRVLAIVAGKPQAVAVAAKALPRFK